MSPMSEPVLISWSGGKDSAMVLESLRMDSHWHVAGLLTNVDENGDVYGQGIPRAILHRQATLLDLPLHEAMCAGTDNAAYESSLAAALAEARRRVPRLRHVAFGDLFLSDVRAYREALLARHDFAGVFPLWGLDTASLARTFIANGHRAALCRIDTTQLDARFCGREFDDALLSELPSSCDPCGERGEFHTCLHAGPLLAEPIPFVRGARAPCDGQFVNLDFEIA